LSLRVVGGALRGHRLKAPVGRHTRPTRQLVREAWFNVLGERVHGARVLDLFAGSGALGIEALSRGAAEVHFIESDRRAARILEGNLKRLELVSSSRLSRRDVFAFLASPESAQSDIALADPPYGGGLAERLVLAFLSDPFADLLCVEHAPGQLDGRDATWTRRYGDSSLSFFAARMGGSPGER